MAALEAERQRQTDEAAARLELMATLETERQRQTEEAAARLEVIEELARRQSELEVLDADLADVIRSQRRELEDALAGLTNGRDDLSPREARALVEIALLQLRLVDERLLIPPAPQGFPRLRYQTGRMRALTVPRLGRLRHYEPRPLQVPARYLSTRAPEIAPAISIVTPSYQHRRFIERTILSVLGQDYPAIEYVVQDGASTDGTVELLERYSARLAAWKSEPDTGQADAINRGFDNTTGEIMGWLNSDDLLLPGALAYVGSYLAAHPEVDVVYGNRLLIDDNDSEIGAWILPPHDDVALTLADFVPQETLFWRRRIWDAAGGRLDPSFGYAMDWDLLLRFQDAGATHGPVFPGSSARSGSTMSRRPRPLSGSASSRWRRSESAFSAAPFRSARSASDFAPIFAGMSRITCDSESSTACPRAVCWSRPGSRGDRRNGTAGGGLAGVPSASRCWAADARKTEEMARIGRSLHRSARQPNSGSPTLEP